ncbi:hypothetical protein EHS25_007347 [Saitozyma podzolica]|uniref:PBP domain-containing protein n=1 Tax=Saitozyma podzolica TaxID=1890683 RepID=A0A427XMN0_9TREE|nr:hypothetical protein EHS25_007347 [Saitozyma podzolica]
MVGVINDWILNFQRYHPGVHLLAPAPYDNNVVFPQLMNKTLDGIFLSREDTPVDVVNFYKKYGYEVTSVPILGGSYRSFGFIDPLVFCVHPSNPLNYVTLQQIDSIMSVTRNRGGPEITTWGQLGLTGEWANKTSKPPLPLPPRVEMATQSYMLAVQIYSSSVYQGFEEFARQKILNYHGKRGVWKYPYSTNSSTPFPLDQNQPAYDNVHWYPFMQVDQSFVSKWLMTRQLRSGQRNIYGGPLLKGKGYSSLAYVDSPVKIIGIKDDYETTKPEYPVGVTPLAPPATGRQWHAPTYDELAAATYPLVRVNTWTTNNGQPGSQPDPIIEELTRYILSYEGQQVTLGYGIFMPLRAHQAADALAAWYQGGNTFDLNK